MKHQRGSVFYGMLLGVFVGLLGSWCSLAMGQGDDAPHPTPEQWVEDLDTLAENLLSRHPNFYTRHTVEEFEDALSAVVDRVGSLSDVQMVMEISRLVAMGGDAHTTVNFGAYRQRMRQLPIQCIVLTDGMFISAATAEHQDLIGSQILRFGSVDALEAIDRVSVLFGHENRSWMINAGCSFVVLMPALEAVGIADAYDAPSFDLTIRDPNGEDSERVVSLETVMSRTHQSWVSFAQSFGDEMPLAYRKSHGYYQTEFLADSKTMYLAYNKCADAEDFPMKLLVEFIKEKSAELDARRLVIDLRFNGGGDETVLWPMMEMLKNSERFSVPGGVIVLTSRWTFSSAMTNAHQLRERVGAVLIGEPTGGKPNHFGALGSFVLPNSQLTISHSTKTFVKVDGDPDSVYPDVLVELDSADFFAGHDRVLESALSYEPE